MKRPLRAGCAAAGTPRSRAAEWAGAEELEDDENERQLTSPATRVRRGGLDENLEDELEADELEDENELEDDDENELEDGPAEEPPNPFLVFF